jgi:hypothetical protein
MTDTIDKVKGSIRSLGYRVSLTRGDVLEVPSPNFRVLHPDIIRRDITVAIPYREGDCITVTRHGYEGPGTTTTLTLSDDNSTQTALLEIVREQLGPPAPLSEGVRVFHVIGEILFNDGYAGGGDNLAKYLAHNPGELLIARQVIGAEHGRQQELYRRDPDFGRAVNFLDLATKCLADTTTEVEEAHNVYLRNTAYGANRVLRDRF